MKTPIKNVVLVHGAFADGSGYEALFHILNDRGYNVFVVQNPLSSLEEDVNQTNIILDRVGGPAVLVGHSWGGAVITEAGNHPNAAALVYVAALQPDNDQSALDCITSLPPSEDSAILPPDEKGIVYNSKEKFHGGFCADLDARKAAFMWASQGAFYAKAFSTPITNAAWKTKPCWGCVATEDKTINPDIQRNMYSRSNTKITEIKGSHVIFMSQPASVAEVIIEAAESYVQ
ncbi:alpha/beta hydrolase [Mucilaginibacter rubeus]|uniref:Alpha/beta hydrolase n=1 Tax=Mucilaginibacter rubeus TaxID=2027860 RepID=A0A5C1I9F7_9SPHI|nr:alpha/beta hydrolase [Mucilaginibacter rubeus]QEM14248.1 alpha/beta hydrolase [Mucilaginibacter rubeus]